MTTKDKIRLNRRIERGLYQLFLEQRKAEKSANKFLRKVDKIRNLRKLLLDAKSQLWLKEE